MRRGSCGDFVSEGTPETVDIELADKGGEIVVLEVARENVERELARVLHDEAVIARPGYYVVGVRIVHHFKGFGELPAGGNKLVLTGQCREGSTYKRWRGAVVFRHLEASIVQ